MYQKSFLSMLLFASIAHFSVTQLFAQEEKPEIIIISERVGKEIDREEAEKFKLFQGINGFQSAVYLKLADNRYFLNITYHDDKTGELKIKRIQQSKIAIMNRGKYIDRFEEIQAGKYQAEKSSKSGIFSEADSMFSIVLKDGAVLKGKIIQKDETSITIRTPQNLEIKVPKSSINNVTSLTGLMDTAEFYRLDPNYSRLMFAPTGRPLRKGEGYFSDYYVFFPGISYGFTDNLTVMAGMSVMPGASLAEQLKYIAPKFGIQISNDLAISAGTLYMSAGGEVSAGIAFAVSTFGGRDKSFTAGLGVGYTKTKGEDFEFAKHPILMLGGNVRLSNSVAFITENWLILGGDVAFDEQPFALALRFFGDRLAADVGFIIPLVVLQHGFPIPWLSLVYNFGK